MPRAPRIHYSGAVYHVMARGVDGREIFLDDFDRRMFLATMGGLKKDTSCSVLAYCPMGNHFHFALKVGNVPLSRIMHRLLTTYVMAFNSRHDREGHLFQARYKSFLCLDNAYLRALIRYIHMNPVRAGLVAGPDHWPWSSHLQYAKNTAAEFVDRRIFFDALGGEDYSRWVRRQDSAFSPWPEEKPSSPLFRDEDTGKETLEKIASELFPGDVTGIRSDSRLRVLSQKRCALALHAIRQGHSLASIAEWMGRTPAAIHHLLERNK